MEDAISKNVSEVMLNLTEACPTKEGAIQSVEQTEKSSSSVEHDSIDREIAVAMNDFNNCRKPHKYDSPEQYEQLVSYTNSSPDDTTFDIIECEYTFEEVHIDLLLKCLRDNQFAVSNNQAKYIFDDIFCRCYSLFNKDYYCKLVENKEGSLCDNYPQSLIIPVTERGVDGNLKRSFNVKKYEEMVEESCHSRCRSRFAVPVIFANEKFICRSATLSVAAGAAFEKVWKKISTDQGETSVIQYLSRPIEIFRNALGMAEAVITPLINMKEVLKCDINLLKILNIELICDLMVENGKLFKNVLKVSSSEKENKDDYCDFKIEQMPFPGCEFFAQYHENKRDPVGLLFYWGQECIDIELKLSDNSLAESLGIDLKNYKVWDLVDLTKNYMKIFLSYFVQGTGGILIHCISGWDRTPLMISLLRMSLWADGIIHKNLNLREIAYLTMAYDWFLFGHNLPTRLQRKEEIMHFCFKILAEIATDEFSATKLFQEMNSNIRGNGGFPDFTAGRRSVLVDLSSFILNLYDRRISMELGFNF